MATKNADVNFLEKVSFKRIYLNKVEAVNLKNEKLLDVQEFQGIQATNYEIMTFIDNNLILKLRSKVGFEPRALFELNTEFIIECKFKEPITEEDIRENINLLAGYITNDLSFITAFITDKMLNKPFIIPPIIEIK